MLLFCGGLPARGVFSGSGGLDLGRPQPKFFDLQGCTVVHVEYKAHTRQNVQSMPVQDLENAVPVLWLGPFCNKAVWKAAVCCHSASLLFGITDFH